MQKSKRPGGNQGEADKLNQVDSFYPAAPGFVKINTAARLFVNGECGACGYFRPARQSGSARHGRLSRSFCFFTGENVPDGWSCDFWVSAQAVAEVEHD